MEVIMDWISTHIMEILTFALVIITGIYAVLTWRYVRLTRQALEENRQMHLDAHKPKIEIYLREKYETLGRHKDGQSIYLYVENTRAGPAYDVHFELVDPSFPLPGDRLLKDIPFIQYDISYLPPGQNRSYRLSSELVYATHNELMQRQLQIKVTYKDSRSETYDDCFPLDFRLYAGQ